MTYFARMLCHSCKLHSHQEATLPEEEVKATILGHGEAARWMMKKLASEMTKHHVDEYHKDGAPLDVRLVIHERK